MALSSNQQQMIGGHAVITTIRWIPEIEIRYDKICIEYATRN